MMLRGCAGADGGKRASMLTIVSTSSREPARLPQSIPDPITCSCTKGHATMTTRTVNQHPCHKE